MLLYNNELKKNGIMCVITNNCLLVYDDLNCIDTDWFKLKRVNITFNKDFDSIK